MHHKIFRILLAILIVFFSSAPQACFGKSAEEANNELRDSTAYGRFMHAAELADKQGNNAEAQKNFSAAMQEAQKFSAKEKPRKLTLSLLGLARVYAKENKNADAEAMYKQALKTAEQPPAVDPEEAKVLGKLNLQVSTAGSDITLTVALYQYASFLRKTNRAAEADKMEARARGLKAK